MTPVTIRIGETKLMSNDSTSVTIAVPTSAPSMTASAGAVAMSPCPANAATMSAVAVLLCSSAVTDRPAANALPRLLMLRRRRRRSVLPYWRRIPVRTRCVPHTSSATPDSRSSSIFMPRPPSRVARLRPTVPHRGCRTRASSSASEMTSGGDSVRTLPWPTLKDRPRDRHSYIVRSASSRAGRPSGWTSSMPSSKPMPRTSPTSGWRSLRRRRRLIARAPSVRERSSSRSSSMTSSVASAAAQPTELFSCV